MKTYPTIGTRILICLALVAGAYFWATSLMDSIYAYRSPLKDQPPQPGSSLLPRALQPAARRVVFVLIDGLRLDTALDAQAMPNLDLLRLQGAWAAHAQPAAIVFCSLLFRSVHRRLARSERWASCLTLRVKTFPPGLKTICSRQPTGPD